MRKIFAALAAVLAAFRTVTRRVWDAASATYRTVAETVLSPLAAVFGGGGADEPEGPSGAEVQKLATDAKAAGEREQLQRSALDQLATSLSRVARALRDEREPDLDDAGLLAPCHVRYLQGLTRDELGVLAAPSVSARKACRSCVEGEAVIGLPSRKEVEERVSNVPVTRAEHGFRAKVNAQRARRMGLPEDMTEDVVNRACAQTICGLVPA
jgi:hypothetical protein